MCARLGDLVHAGLPLAEGEPCLIAQPAQLACTVCSVVCREERLCPPCLEETMPWTFDEFAD